VIATDNLVTTTTGIMALVAIVAAIVVLNFTTPAAADNKTDPLTTFLLQFTA
jgi:hypothetical protein